MTAKDLSVRRGESRRRSLDGGLATVAVRQIADHSPAVMILVSADDHRIAYANPAAHRAAHAAPGRLLGEVVTAAFPFLDPIGLGAAQARHDRGVLDARGATRLSWDVSYVAIEGALAEGAGVLVTAVDVTHHEADKAKAQTAQDTLDALLAYIPQGISISHGPDVQVERISAQGLALIGRTLEEVRGRSAVDHPDVWDVGRPGSGERVAARDRPLARATRTGEVVVNEMLTLRRSDGAMLTVLCNSGPIRDPSGRVVGAVAAWQDVGELQNAQAAIRRSEERFRAVLHQIPAAMFIVDAPDGRVVFKSRLLDEVLGAPDTQLSQPIGTVRGHAVHRDGSPYEMHEYPSRRALYKGESVRAEPMVYCRGDGVLIDLEMHAGPVCNEAGEIVAAVAVAFDVTERRIAEERRAVLLQLQEVMDALTDPDDIMSAAAALLGRRLHAGRVGFTEIQPDGEAVLITTPYETGDISENGRIPLAACGSELLAELRQGRTIIYQDAQAEGRAPQHLYAQRGTRGHLSVPVLRNGVYVGSFFVSQFKPYAWRPWEVALIEEAAGRIWDCLDRARAQVRLRESEERLRFVTEATALGIWEYDAITQGVVRSARHDAILGYAAPAPDWSFERFLEHVAEGDRSAVAASVAGILEAGGDLDLEVRTIRADGARGWIQVRAKAGALSDGTVTRVIGAIADITKRKQAELAIAESAARFETLAQAMPSMVWSASPGGLLEWCNARVSEYSGVPSDRLRSDHWLIIHEDDLEAARARWTQALASGEPFQTEYRIRRHDGVYRWHLARAIAIRDVDGEIVNWIGANTDIQDQKSSEAALAALNATLEEQIQLRTAELLAAEATLRQSQKMEAVGQLTGGLAHDFNNLLTGITGSLELLAVRLGQGRINGLERYVDIAQESARRAAALTHRLLAFARRQTLDPRPTDVNQLVYGMEELIRRTVGPMVAVTVKTDLELWPVLADPNQLENALLNLCINSRDAMPEGGRITIATRGHQLGLEEARALELPPGDYASLEVKDTGAGMAPEVAARAFDPFFTTKPIGEGTGLGLSMVYGFARQSGGQARIHSELGHGAAVTIHLPRYRGEESLGCPPPPAFGADVGGDATVLVVDDEPSVRVIVREVLQELGYEVLEAENGASGLQILESGIGLDLLITDVGLPGGINGRQLADAAQAARPSLKILFITGYAETAVVGDVHLKSGMHILVKPFTIQTLAERVLEVIAAGAEATAS
jgi:PAS domain S-box-containing protein